VTFSVLVAGHARTGDVEGARRIVSDMAAANLRPNVVTWTSLISACAAARPKRPEESERLFRQMVRCGITPNRTTIDTLAWAAGRPKCTEICQELGLQPLPWPVRKGAGSERAELRRTEE
ncbi:unnamed protein product, partial [Polarella glacialis]